MNIQEFPVLSREDLKPQYKNVSVEKIIGGDSNPFIRLTSYKMHKFNIIFFIDDNGDIFIIKNRYGKNSKEYLDYLLKQLEIFTDRAINAEKFISNLSGSKWWQLFNVRKKCRRFVKRVLNGYNN